jgi:hypothetical protein
MSGGGNPPFGVDPATAVLHLIADLLLMHIKADVIGNIKSAPFAVGFGCFVSNHPERNTL